MTEASGQTRVISLDALRGFAVMGILAMNIVAFAMPFWAYITPLAYGGETEVGRGTWLASYVLFDGKMRGFFSLLFGASMMLIIDGATAKGESAAKVHYARMLWLALFGLAHFYFIWFGDILFLYAVVGCLAFLFRNWKSRRLIKWALIIFAIHLIVFGAQFIGLQVMQFFATQPGAPADLVKQYNEIMASPDFDFETARQLALHRGDYSGIVGDKLASWWEPIGGVLQSIGETLPLMMIGMACQKNGFLTGQWTREEYVRIARKMIIPGLILSSVVGLMVMMANYDKITALAAFFVWSAIPRTMLTIGYAAVLMLVVARYANTGFIARVAATGRAAFTNYLGTSIVMTTIFYGYGFGLFGYVSRPALWLFVLGAWGVMLLWSKPWLERFQYGPLEWLWRSLARMELQPMARARS
jgi:uncharacterized protein